MDPSPASRFVDLLGRLGYKTQQQIADLLDIARPTAGTIVRLEKEPSFSSVATLKQRHPEVNMEWVFTGAGSPFVTGDTMPLLITPVEEPAATYARPAPSDAINKLLDHITELGQRHAEALKAAKKDARHQLDEQARLFQYAIDLIANARDTALARVRELEYELDGLKLTAGLRAPTPAEEEHFEKQAQARKEKEEKSKKRAGFKSYDEQPAHQEQVLHLSYSDPLFTRQPEAPVVPMWHNSQEAA